MEERGDLLPARQPTSSMWSVSAYVLLLELDDALTYYGISQGFKNFMQAKLGYSQVGASSLRSTWTSFCDIVPLTSAYVADEHLGRFRAILLAGTWYVGGICFLVVASHPVVLTEDNAAANAISALRSSLASVLATAALPRTCYFYLSMNVGSTVSFLYLAYLCVHPIVPPEAGYLATFVLCGVVLLLTLLHSRTGTGLVSLLQDTKCK
ncbi:hypothetical protein SPRG_14172 [Saprolegnia parasitica CBS 223.65]|uniref:Uncharacterized protein n=1 Tax=Saprolegnia parasitica (strain CBS 223.65) TaxID=695850 RepID=A0A067BND9_SAPPC|nr:hypothetical protein SPRG_14172 [Saprolegnia parasitica CBS 223.65]KDO20024.1 hypothetical protein SPRG_14172 [Saprolegnia parasitica CBS 223.65]|eukprot:XP_012209258.1 hypothetical protein SPRG_14172 [Saprolegnia parasitica CBS 223.65]